MEIHFGIEENAPLTTGKNYSTMFAIIIIQIIMVDMVFSIDSIVTAIGMTKDLGVTATAVIIALVAMYFAFGAIAKFINILKQRNLG